jgi:hypothetical protein
MAFARANNLSAVIGPSGRVIFRNLPVLEHTYANARSGSLNIALAKVNTSGVRHTVAGVQRKSEPKTNGAAPTRTER